MESNIRKGKESEVAQSCPTLCDPMDCVAYQAPLSRGLSQKKILDFVAISSPGDLPDPMVEPMSLASPALAGVFLTTVPPGNSEKK